MDQKKLLNLLSVISFVLLLAFVGGALYWVSQLAQERADLVRQVDELKNEIKSTRTEAAELKEPLAKVRGDLTKIEDDVERLKKEAVVALPRRVDDQEKQLKAQAHELQQLSADLGRQKEDLDSLKMELQKYSPARITSIPVKVTGDPRSEKAVDKDEKIILANQPEPVPLYGPPKERVLAAWYSLRDNLDDLGFFQRLDVTVNQNQNQVYLHSSYRPGFKPDPKRPPPTIHITVFILHRQQ
jgi:hypothetical protein